MLSKPNTFMNLSGGPVGALIKQIGLPLERLILIHDDIDMDFGKIRIRWDGKDGGHKGVRSVIEGLRCNLFYRMKIGVGRDPFMAPEDYVLSPFKSEESDDLAYTLDRAVDALHTFVFESKEKAMSMFNRSAGL